MEYFTIDFVLLILVLAAALFLIWSTYFGCENFSNITGSVTGDGTPGFRNKNLFPPNSTQPNIDYQDYLDNSSGYNSATRGYSNPYYADSVAAGLDTN